MTPTVGRIVHYRPIPTDHRYGDCSLPDVLPAIIVRVWSDTCVQLQVFTDGPSGSIWRPSVVEGTEPGQWSWPPLV